ncbi:MAG: hypothetical protein WC750_00780 [Patescibacteria group bacterium]|jgi:hypothetical protein
MSKENPTTTQEKILTPDDKRALQEKIRSLNLKDREGREELFKLLKGLGYRQNKHDSNPAEWNIDESGTPILGKTNLAIEHLCTHLDYGLDYSLRSKDLQNNRIMGDDNLPIAEPTTYDLSHLVGHFLYYTNYSAISYLNDTEKDFPGENEAVRGQVLKTISILFTIRTIIDDLDLARDFESQQLSDKPRHHLTELLLDTALAGRDAIELFYKFLQKRIRRETIDKMNEEDEGSIEQLYAQAAEYRKDVRTRNELEGTETDPEAIFKRNKELIGKIHKKIKELSVALDAT